MRIEAVVFPFDAFDSGGTAAGAELLGDLLREIIDDTKQEMQPVRQKVFADHLNIDEIVFDTPESIANWRSIGCETAQRALKSEFTVWITGSHLGVLPVFDILEKRSLVFQLDAHLDCYELHDTKSSLSHGNFLREVQKMVVNLGHRDLFLPKAAMKEPFVSWSSAEKLALDEKAELDEIRRLAKKYGGARGVWLDIDADVFDPSICPGVQNPLPGGLMLPQLLRVVNAIGPLRGASISEFDPGRDVRDQSLQLLGWLLEWLLLRAAERRKPK